VTGLLAALVLASASGPTGAVDVAALEARAAEAVQGAFTAAKLPVPARDPALSLAARDISKLMATGSLSAAGLAEAVPAAISRAGGWDPAPRSVVLGGSSADGIVQYLRAQQSLTEDRADVFGVGISVQTGKLTLLVVTARRYATVSTFPRTLPVGGQAELAVTLRAPLRNPQLVVTAPDGRAETNSAAVAAGETLTAGLTFPAAGRYTIEVMGRGPEGPKVAALFGVTVGPVGKAMASDDGPEPKDPIAKIDAVLAHINRVRARAKAGPLVHDHNLDVLALEQAEDMATHHFFAHVSPTRGDLHQRLTGRYAYVRAGENLGEADGALAAERAIEGSPAHLENTLDPRFTHVGLALFPNRHPGGEQSLLLTEIFVTPPERLKDPAGSIYNTLNAERLAHHLAPLGRERTLDDVAREHLGIMIQDGEPGGERDAQDAAIEADGELEAVAVDLFVGSGPDDALHSRNVLSSGFNRVGIAAQLVTSHRYGADRLWICILYGTLPTARR
jgi:uncharacterized protein YkwD